MTREAIDWIILCFQIGSNAVSMLVIIATLLFIQERWLSGKSVLTTLHEKFVFVLIVVSFFQAISNMFIPSNETECFYSIFFDHITVHFSVLTFLFICLMMLVVALTDKLSPYFAFLSIGIYVLEFAIICASTY